MPGAWSAIVTGSGGGVLLFEPPPHALSATAARTASAAAHSTRPLPTENPPLLTEREKLSVFVVDRASGPRYPPQPTPNLGPLIRPGGYGVTSGAAIGLHPAADA